MKGLSVSGFVISLLLMICMGLLVSSGCTPPRVYDAREVSVGVNQVNTETFSLSFDNPNFTRVGVEFRVRIYRWDGTEPESYLEHIYVAPQNKRSHSVRTGGCGDRPPGLNEDSECNLRVTAVLLDQYNMGSD